MESRVKHWLLSWSEICRGRAASKLYGDCWICSATVSGVAGACPPFGTPLVPVERCTVYDTSAVPVCCLSGLVSCASYSPDEQVVHCCVPAITTFALINYIQHKASGHVFSDLDTWYTCCTYTSTGVLHTFVCWARRAPDEYYCYKPGTKDGKDTLLYRNVSHAPGGVSFECNTFLFFSLVLLCSRTGCAGTSLA